MILRLAFAQLRANRGHTLWVASLLTLLVAVLTGVMVVGATQAELNREQSRLWGHDLERSGWAELQTGDAVSDDGYPLFSDVSPSELAAIIARANAAGVLAVAVVEHRVGATGDTEWHEDSSPPDNVSLLAITGSRSLDAVIASGHAPTAAGEVALTLEALTAFGAHVGDRIVVYAPEPSDGGESELRPVSLLVVGVAKSDVLPGYEVYLPDGYVHWDELSNPAGAMTYDAYDTGAAWSTAQIHWGGPYADLDRFYEEGWIPEPTLAIDLPMGTAPWIGVAALLVVAMVVMAFAVGRSQAATRTQWVATARTMGARRSYIAIATAVETLLLATCAVVAGVPLGILGAQVPYAIARGTTGNAFGPFTVQLSVWIAPIVLGAVMVVAIAIAAVPAFWASRVAPSAALKPVSDITESEVSRRVSPNWASLLVALGLAGIASGHFTSRSATYAISGGLGWIVFVVAGIALTVETMRRLVARIGRRMSGQQSTAARVAGDALVTRPRQAAAPALLTAAAVLAVTLLAASTAQQSAINAWYWPEESPGGVVFGDALHNWVGYVFNGPVLAVACLGGLTLQLVASAMFSSHRAVTSREAAALRAMGLSAQDQRRAYWRQQWVPQAVGCVVGVLIGLAVFVVLAALDLWAADESEWVFRAGESEAATYGVAGGLVGGLAASALLLGIAAVAAALVARSSTPATPVAGLVPQT